MWTIAGASLLATATMIAPSADAARESIRIEIAGELEPRENTKKLLHELFPDAEFELELVASDAINPIDVVDPPDLPRPAAARVWIELGHPRRVVIYVTDGDWDRVLIRRLQFEQVDAVALEEVAFVVDASVHAILDGGEIGIALREAARELGVDDPPPAGPAVAPASPPPRPAWSITAGYRLRAWQRATFVHGPSLGVAVWAQRPHLWIGGGLVGHAYLPVDVGTGNLRLQLRGGHVGALAEILFPVHQNLALAVEPAAGLDLVRDETTVIAAPAEAFPPTTRALPTLGLDAGFDLVLGNGRDRLRVSLRGGLDVDTLGIRYVTADTGTTLFEPWRFRPGASVRLGWLRQPGG